MLQQIRARNRDIAFAASSMNGIAVVRFQFDLRRYRSELDIVVPQLRAKSTRFTNI